MAEEKINVNPENFIDQFEYCFNWLVEIVSHFDDIELSPRQKAQVAGMLLGSMAQVVKINDKLKEWGYLP